MLEKNLKLVGQENRMIFRKSPDKNLTAVGNLPLNLLIEEFTNIDDKNKKSLKNNLTWNRGKPWKITANSNDTTLILNLNIDNTEEDIASTMDPNINDLNKKYKSLTLHHHIGKKSRNNVRSIYDEEDLKILRDLLNVLKTHKAHQDSLEKNGNDSTNKVLIARGHIKKSAEKKRPTPISRPSHERFVSPANLSLNSTDGNRGRVFVQNEQRQVFPERMYDDVIQLLNNQYSVDEFIKDLELELSNIESFETLANEGNSNSQALNIQCEIESQASLAFVPQSEYPYNNFTKPSVATHIPQQNNVNRSPMASLPPPYGFTSQHSLMNYSQMQNEFTNDTFNNCPIQNLLSPEQNNTNSKCIGNTTPRYPYVYSTQNSPSSAQVYINQAAQQKESLYKPYCSPMAYTRTTPIPFNFSPSHAEFDSCYETGSPSGSSSVTSPGSPTFRCSISSESDQELTSNDFRFMKSKNTSDQVLQKKQSSCRVEQNKSGQALKPLGEAIQYSTDSAERRLHELSTSAAWKGPYNIQLVRVVISTKNGRVEGFRESLMKIAHTHMDKKQEKTWQLAIFVHLDFLKASVRVEEYKAALLKKHEDEASLLYITAIDRNCGLIARYVAEIMLAVGFNPAQQVDVKGNSILHELASLGDSHAEVLGELLAASDAQRVNKIFNTQCTNKEGKTPLHVAAASPHPQITTIILLINHGADPTLKDNFGQMALQYHLTSIEKRLENGRWQHTDLELARKLLPPSSVESRMILDRLYSDYSASDAIRSLLEDLKIKRW